MDALFTLFKFKSCLFYKTQSVVFGESFNRLYIVKEFFKLLIMRNFKYSFLCILLFACGGSDEEITSPLSNQNQIISFIVSGESSVINNVENTVLATIPERVLTSLSPTIIISNGATISPASGVSQDFSNPVTYTVTAEDGSTVSYSVTVTSTILTIFSFTISGTTYEFVEEEMTWEDAIALAIERGGVLAEINSIEENLSIASEIRNNTGIDFSGNAGVYVWLGGNNFGEINTWIFDGDNDGNGFQFWMGDLDGVGIDGVFSNWANNQPQSIDQLTGTELPPAPVRMILAETPFFLAGQWLRGDPSSLLFPLIELN